MSVQQEPRPPTPGAPMTDSARPRFLKRLRSHVAEEIMLVILVMMCLVLSLFEPAFLSPLNLLNVLRIVSITGIIAFGMTMVIISAEIDLSVGSAAAFCGCLLAVVIDRCDDLGVGPALGVPVAIAATLAAGFGIGAFTGLMRAKFTVPTFITTLALLTGLRGAALLITGGFPVTSLPPWLTFLGGGNVLGVPFPTIVFVLVFLVVHFLMNFTVFGRSIYAVGGNAEAARLSGISVVRVRILVMAITGLLSAVAGILLAAKIGSGTPTVAAGLELDVIAAVIIGGTSLFGGEGRVWGTLVGLVFIGVIVNGMTLLDVQADMQYVVRGALILVAVLINQATIHRGRG